MAQPFWSLPAGEVLTALATDSNGLAAAEAAARLTRAGPNRLKGARRTSTLQLLARQFASPLVLMLAFAAILSLAVHETRDAVIILIILLASGLLGFWQERGAADAVRKLLEMVAVRTRVLRDGREPGDRQHQSLAWRPAHGALEGHRQAAGRDRGEDVDPVAAENRAAVDTAQKELEARVFDAQGQGPGKAADAAGSKLRRERQARAGVQDRAEAPAAAGAHTASLQLASTSSE